MEFRTYSPSSENTFVSSMEMRIRSGSDFLRNRIRILVMGSRGVGKQSFVQYFLREKNTREYRQREIDYPEAMTKSKIIAEFTVVDDEFNPALRKLSVKQAQCFVLVYSVDDQSSFEHVCELKDHLRILKGPDVPILVIGNKNDIAVKQVHPIVADCVVSIDWELPHIVVSVKSGEGMGNVYRTLMDEMCKQKVVKYVKNMPVYDTDAEKQSPGQVSLGRRMSAPAVSIVSPAAKRIFRERGGSTSRSKWVLIKTFFVGDKV